MGRRRDAPFHVLGKLNTLSTVFISIIGLGCKSPRKGRGMSESEVLDRKVIQGLKITVQGTPEKAP
jgi:hypothetical protein